MGDQILPPCGFDGRLEGEDENPLKAHFLCQLIGGKGLAEAHFGVPEELGDAGGGFQLGGAEIGDRFQNGVFLLGTHPEVMDTLFFVVGPGLDRDPGSPDIVDGAAEPFAVGIAEAVPSQIPVNIVICEGAAVLVHGGFLENDFIGLAARPDGRILLRDTFFHIALGIADLQHPLIQRVVVRIGIDHRMTVRPGREEIHFRHSLHPLTPLV